MPEQRLRSPSARVKSAAANTDPERVPGWGGAGEQFPLPDPASGSRAGGSGRAARSAPPAHPPAPVFKPGAPERPETRPPPPGGRVFIPDPTDAAPRPQSHGPSRPAPVARPQSHGPSKSRSPRPPGTPKPRRPQVEPQGASPQLGAVARSDGQMVRWSHGQMAADRSKRNGHRPTRLRWDTARQGLTDFSCGAAALVGWYGPCQALRGSPWRSPPPFPPCPCCPPKPGRPDRALPRERTGPPAALRPAWRRFPRPPGAFAPRIRPARTATQIRRRQPRPETAPRQIRCATPCPLRRNSM